MENQQEQQPKLLDDLPTFVANDQTKYDLDLADLTTFKVDVGGDHHDQQQQQQPTKQTEVAKADAAPAPPEPSETSVLDMANPDLFVIGQPSSQNFVDLDFDLNPPPPPPTVNTDAPVTAKDSSIITATTNGDAADAELSAITSTTTNGDDWSTFETHSQPTITAAELQFAKSSSSSLANESLANITCVENTSCIDSLLSDLPEETFVEDENIGSGNNKSQNNDKSDLNWSSSDYKEEVVTAPSVVAFELSKPEEVVLPPPTKEEDSLPSPSPPPSPQPISADILTGSGDQVASTVVPDVGNTNEGSGGDDSTVPTFEAAITTTEEVAAPVAVEEVAAPASVAEEVAAPAPVVEEVAAPAVAKEVAAAAVVAEEEAKEEEPLLLSANDRDTDDHLAAADNTPPVVVAKQQQQQQDSSLTETQAEAVETAASASATESPNTRLQEQQQQPLPSPSPVSFSQSSSASPPDTASAPLSTAAAATTKTDTTTATTTTTMGRKNQSYRRENSNDEAESSGPGKSLPMLFKMLLSFTHLSCALIHRQLLCTLYPPTCHFFVFLALYPVARFPPPVQFFIRLSFFPFLVNLLFSWSLVVLAMLGLVFKIFL